MEFVYVNLPNRKIRVHESDRSETQHRPDTPTGISEDCATMAMALTVVDGYPAETAFHGRACVQEVLTGASELKGRVH